MSRWIAPVLCAMACVAHADPKPAERGKQIVDAQVAALKGDGVKLAETFATGTILLVPEPRPITRPGLVDAIRRTSPHQVLKTVKVAKLVADGNEQAVWVSAELTLSIAGNEPGEKPRTSTISLRVTELATAEAGWKVVAGAFSQPHDPTMEKDGPAPIDGATDAGPLSALLADPVKLEAAFAKGAAVAAFGTDKSERAYGDAAAHAMVKKWSKLALAAEGKPREVRGKTWGYSLAYVNWNKKGDPYPSRMAALVIGVPDAQGGWTVVAAHYAPL